MNKIYIAVWILVLLGFTSCDKKPKYPVSSGQNLEVPIVARAKICFAANGSFDRHLVTFQDGAGLVFVAQFPPGQHRRWVQERAQASGCGVVIFRKKIAGQSPRGVW